MVVYHAYVRSFADSTGDGDGDLAGLTARLEHLAWLGVDGLWLSPIFPSPMADGGYDVAWFTDVDPRFGTLADLDALIARAHDLGLRVLLDLVPCHTSIEHPWFVEHPERYVLRDARPDGRLPNNWVANFGGPAWSPDPHGRGLYLHSFFPEQPDLDWGREEVHAAMAEVVAFWRTRGVDGFRLDALQHVAKDPELRDDPPATGPPPVSQHPAFDALEHVHSADGPGTGTVLRTLRAAAGEDALLVGEVFVREARLGRYLEHLDGVFAFGPFFSPWCAADLAAAIAAAPPRSAWVLGNHDFPRLADRIGERHLYAAATLLLTLPGSAFLYQGDEIGQHGGPPSHEHDRFGRDPCRRPLQWDAGPTGGFTSGTPWLEPVDPRSSQRRPTRRPTRAACSVTTATCSRCGASSTARSRSCAPRTASCRIAAAATSSR